MFHPHQGRIFKLCSLECSLIVDNIGIEDDGVYTITASNSVGDTIATAKLVCHSKYHHLSSLLLSVLYIHLCNTLRYVIMYS